SPGPVAGASGRGPAATASAITATLSVPQKVGQLLVAAVPGVAAGDGGADLVRRYHLGGVIYFGANARSPAQLAALSNGLQRAALGQRPAAGGGRSRPVPLLIGTDQEGGIVSRLSGIATLFPNQMAAGATRDPALIKRQELLTGRQLRAVGVNLDYAPVADVNTDPANPVIGVRSFGARPGLVARMTAAAVAGFHAAGEAAVAKHFPGHGDTSTDSHSGLAVVHRSWRQWWRIDARPFRAAVRAGADEIMVGHIAVPALDRSGLPASLSRRIITGLLRDRLGYRGVIVTDSLVMGGVLAGRTGAQVAVMAIRAGADELLMPGSIPVAYRALLAAVRSGRISMARLNTAVTRIIALKAARGILAHPLVNPASAARHEDTPAGRATAAGQAARSITMVANRRAGGHPVLPLRGRRVYLAGPEARALAGPLRAALARAGGRLAGSPAAAQDIVLATRNAATDPKQRRLAARLAAAGRPVIVVATGVPYDLGMIRRAAAGLATYSAAGVSLTAAADVLAGLAGPRGRLPV
ncbi:MAG: beta-hexosaminidase, partial [Actinobacteria bacterium]|nr:beta-hexosaminidase [Actinomycetota bacterium]